MEYLLILLSFFLIAIFLRWKFNIHNSSRQNRIDITWSLTIAVIGILWDYFAIWQRHWIFPGDGLIGIRIFGLPIEEYLFAFIIPYFALTVYRIYKKKIN